MKFIEIYKTLRHHRELAERRDPMYYSNKAAKGMVYFFFGLFMLYLIGFAVMFSLAANGSHRMTALEFMVGLAPFILAVDFGVRFLAQQTPSQLIKPYILLPLPRYACVDCFVLNSLLSEGNLTWMFMLVPYCLMSVCFGYGFLAALSLLVLFYILELANSQWYAIVRTLVNRKFWWWALPIAAYAVVALPWIVRGFRYFCDFYSGMGTGMEYGNVLPHLGGIVALVLLTTINRRVQYASVMEELGKQKVATMKTVTKLNFLNRYGEIGQYLKLEVKSLMRNKNPRKMFISSIIAIVVISAIITFTDVYDSAGMTAFWCFYNYIIISVGVLPQVMAYEGNYIDFLMVHRENLLKLFTAKYYFYSALILFPFVLMLPQVFAGKWSIWMLIAYAVFTIGLPYCLMLQMAVLNKTRQPLNEKFTGKAGNTNYIQLLGISAIFAIPTFVISLTETMLDDSVAWTVLFAIGALFIATHKLWLRNIYGRWMKKRYENMEALRA